jgi:hypothetical protein
MLKDARQEMVESIATKSTAARSMPWFPYFARRFRSFSITGPADKES